MTLITGHNFWGSPGNYICEIVTKVQAPGGIMVLRLVALELAYVPFIVLELLPQGQT